MLDSVRFVLLASLLGFFANSGAAHEEDEPWNGNISTIVVPQNIDLFTFLRFTRLDHRIILTKLQDGATHHIGTMTITLTQAVVTAGQENPRAVARLVYDMAQLQNWEARNAALNAARALHGSADESAEPALLPLIEIWLANPMDGIGS